MVLSFSYSGFLQILTGYHFGFDLKVMSIFLSMLRGSSSGSFLVGPYLSSRAKPKCYFATEYFLDQPHYVQYNILFVVFMELNILTISINELS